MVDRPGGRFRDRLKATYTKFKQKAFTVRSMEEQKDKTASGFEMHKVLGPFSLVMLGIGCIIGAGVFVLTGVAARKYAGPGVVFSYSISALTAMLTAFCYAEYAAELPVAGGAFNYISMTFGEYAAWVTACDLVLEYTLSAAAVAKGFTAYTAALIGVNVKYLRLQGGPFTLDLPALASVIVLSLILRRSTADSSLFNNIVTGLNVILIIFVLAAGFPYAKSENYHPFAPFGTRGIFTGASVVFFSFIGFDTVATAAEEVKNPGRDLPIGIIGSLSICTVLYVLMCLAITGMQNYTVIDLDAPFAVAFDHVGLGWAQRIVAAGALTGIVTSLLGSLLGQARIYVTLGRQNLLPPWLARVHPTHGTPINATTVTMFTAGALALFIDIELLAELVSIGTLVVFCSVCAGVLFRRYHVHGSGEPARPVLLRLLAVVLCAISFSVSFTERAHIAVPIIFIVLWLAVTASFLMLPVRYVPALFKCPGSPFIPSLGMLATLHLMGSLGWPAYVRWIVWFVLGSIVYLTYGLHRSQGEGAARRSDPGSIPLQEGLMGQTSIGGDSSIASGAHLLGSTSGVDSPQRAATGGPKPSNNHYHTAMSTDDDGPGYFMPPGGASNSTGYGPSAGQRYGAGSSGVDQPRGAAPGAPAAAFGAVELAQTATSHRHGAGAPGLHEVGAHGADGGQGHGRAVAPSAQHLAAAGEQVGLVGAGAVRSDDPRHGHTI